MKAFHPQADELIHQYTHLTGREARVAIYEHALYDFFRAGFTCEEFVCVLTFLLRENKRNKFQYSLKLGHLINAHDRFMDLLGEARAKLRNQVKPPTPKETILHEWRGVKPESNGNGRHIAEVFNAMREATKQ